MRPFGLFNRRNVTLDTNILISYVISKSDNSVVKTVVTKAAKDDNLMITDIIRDEVLAYADKKDAYATKDELRDGIDSLGVEIVKVGPPPSKEELQRRYGIRDIKDGKILYSVETTQSVILVTYDDDYFDGKVHGLDTEIMDPVVYLYEDDIKSGKYVPKRPKNRRFAVIHKEESE